jgi:uncharacterized glyoxalase superfamily protein PhnB
MFIEVHVYRSTPLKQSIAVIARILDKRSKYFKQEGSFSDLFFLQQRVLSLCQTKRRDLNQRVLFLTVSFFFFPFFLFHFTSRSVFSVGSAHKHIAWIEKALGGKTEMVMNDQKDETKVMHAALQVNGGPVYLSDRMGNYGSPDVDETPSRGTHLYLGFDELADAQKIWSSAVKSKGKIHMPFEGQFWGSHYGVVEDPFGSVWAVSAPTPGAKRGGGDDAEAEGASGEKKKGQRKSPRTKGVAAKIDKKNSSTKKRSKK